VKRWNPETCGRAAIFSIGRLRNINKDEGEVCKKPRVFLNSLDFTLAPGAPRPFSKRQAMFDEFLSRPLEMSANRYIARSLRKQDSRLKKLKGENVDTKVNALSPEEQKIVDLKRVTNACLNKLTRENFEKLRSTIEDQDFETVKQLVIVVSIVYEKAVTQSYLGDVYADMCDALHGKSSDLQQRFLHVFEHMGGWCWSAKDGQDDLTSKATYDARETEGLARDKDDVSIGGGPHKTEKACRKEALKQTKFRRLLLNRCQDEFDDNDRYSELEKEEADLKNKKSEHKGPGDATDEEFVKIATNLAKMSRLKREMKARILGNSIFVGHLYNRGIVPRSVLVDSCIYQLVSEPEDEDAECLARLMTTVGKKFDTEDPEDVRILYERIAHFATSKDTGLQKRTQFLLRDLLELRSNKWVPRRAKLVAKTKAEIAKDMAEEERKAAQEERERNSRDRGGRNGNRDGSRHNNNQQYNNRQRSGEGDVRGGPKKILRSNTQPQRQQRQQHGQHRQQRQQPPQLLQPTPEKRVRPLQRGQSAPMLEQKQHAQPAMDVTTMRKTSISTIEEYLGIHNVKEVMTCLSEMSPGHGPIFAEEIFNSVINKKDKDRVLLEQLMVEIVGAKGGISVSDWSKGLMSVMECIEDIKIDVPKCDEWLGKMCGRLLDNKTINMRAIEAILRSLKNDILAMFTWGIIQINGDAVMQDVVKQTFRRSFAWLSSNRDKDTAGKYISALAQGCPAKGIKMGAQSLLTQDLTDSLDNRSHQLELADLGYCVGASWAAAHQRFREPTPDKVDFSLMPRGKSACIEQFITAVFDVAKVDRWKTELRSERLNGLVSAGLFDQQTLEMATQFMPK
jgi:hypothetical protein